tara:strand:+ start:17196 stop:18032 length:837 start_codon:yes stop_codon:yes gene_type:complete
VSCRYDREANDYLTADGEPCETDEYGDPTRHCTARRTCSVHVGEDELTCPRCIARTRANLRRIPTLDALLLPVAVANGADSTAADLAGPAAQPRDWTERRIAMRSHLAAWSDRGRITERQYVHARHAMDETDDRHPLNVLGQWDLMIREDYDHPSQERVTVANAADYLDRQLARIANDPDQDWALMSTEIRKTRRYLERVVSLAAAPERGAPCPDCTSEETGVGPRLVRHYSHWCDDETCERIHYDDDTADQWICPRDRGHVWSHADYERWIEERQGA